MISSTTSALHPLTVLFSLVFALVHLIDSEAKVLDCIPVVLNGYDVVFYHNTSRSQCETKTGLPRYYYNLDSNDSDGDPRLYQFWFSSKHNRDLFANDPWKYAPKYGGFCSWGTCCELSDDGWKWSSTFLGPPSGPDSDNCGFRIHEGSLYLNILNSYDAKFFDTDTDDHIEDGDSRWIEWFGSLEAGVFNHECFSSSGYDYMDCVHHKSDYAPLAVNAQKCNYQRCKNVIWYDEWYKGYNHTGIGFF